MDTRPKIIGLDFDGTVCSTAYPEIGEPKWPHKLILWWVKRLQKKGWAIILYTCRTDQYLDNAVAWLKERGLVPDYVNEHHPDILAGYETESRKIFADRYIDDKNVGFIGWFLRRIK